MDRIASTVAIGASIAIVAWFAWLLYAALSASLCAPTRFFM